MHCGGVWYIWVCVREGESVKMAENIRTFKTTAFKEKEVLMQDMFRVYCSKRLRRWTLMMRWLVSQLRRYTILDILVRLKYSAFLLRRWNYQWSYQEVSLSQMWWDACPALNPMLCICLGGPRWNHGVFPHRLIGDLLLFHQRQGSVVVYLACNKTGLHMRGLFFRHGK